MPFETATRYIIPTNQIKVNPFLKDCHLFIQLNRQQPLVTLSLPSLKRNKKRVIIIILYDNPLLFYIRFPKCLHKKILIQYPHELIFLFLAPHHKFYSEIPHYIPQLYLHSIYYIFLDTLKIHK